MKFCSLLSSSSGNCTYLSSSKTAVLVDIGVSCKAVEQGLTELGQSPEEIQAIFISHEHTDHMKGAGVFARKYGTPIYATCDTWSQMEKLIGKIPETCIRTLDTNCFLSVGDIVIQPFSIPHDAKDPVGYSFYIDNQKITTATDIGHVSAAVEANLRGSQVVLLEANHDVAMLKSGPYPYPLKQRILSDYGHLSNENCGKLAVLLAKSGTKRFLLGHLSAENNRPDLAYQTVCNCFEQAGASVGVDVHLSVAPKSALSEVFSL